MRQSTLCNDGQSRTGPNDNPNRDCEQEKDSMKTGPPRVFAILFSLFLISFPYLSKVHSRDQGREVKVVHKLPDKSKRYALVIGVDEYRDKQINPLYGAAKDARTLAEALVKYAGFPADQVTLLATGEPEEREPSRANILQRLINLNGLVPRDGLLLVSFAGHGMQRGERAFLLPWDVRVGSLSLLENTSISVSQMKDLIRQTGAKQVLVILDACRNDPGGRADGVNPMSRAYRFDFDTRNREVEAFATIYATEVGERAYEYTEKNQGYFTWFLVEGLKGEAANERGEVTLAGLVRYLQEKVPRRVQMDIGQEKKQRPWAYIEGYRADELVISVTVRVTAPASNPTGVDAAAVELSFWESIKNSSDAEDFREYLKEYPNGRFAGLARNRVRQLEVAKSTSTNPTNTQPAPSSESKQEHVELQTYTETIDGVSIEIVRVPAGKFWMGSLDTEKHRHPNEGPRHEVMVSSFYMGRYEVTQAQWRAVATKLTKVKIDLNPDPSHFEGDDLPVERVSWVEAIEFCERLSKATGKTYRLPTEAEWEYACRATTTVPYAGRLDDMAWYFDDPDSKTHSVGQKKPNGFGLHDMHGNVWEWCMDNWHGNYEGAPNDGSVWEGGDTNLRVLRGGAWSIFARDLRSAFRNRSKPDQPFHTVGFRLVKTLR